MSADPGGPLLRETVALIENTGPACAHSERFLDAVETAPAATERK